MTKGLHILNVIITSTFIVLISTVTFGTPIINYGESLEYYAPHHLEPDDPGHPGTPGHYFAETGDAHHYAWLDQIPLTPVIDVFYDFRPVGGFANEITPGQKARAIDAFDLWSSVSNLNFIQNTVVLDSAIINVGTGSLRAFGETSRPGGILGLGGGTFTHDSTHSITGGVAWMDFKDSWDETIGNGNPGGTFDYFTVAVQEIGHALGLGHVDDLSGTDMMDGFYVSEQVSLSINDISHITSVYGASEPIPEPTTIALLGIGLIGLGGIAARRRFKRVKK